ncbi:magnesium transporter NIPA-domain-containing protein [Kalaharituber pfeilii]|nr:magnesium transporter NIPA-domain-containing protein [Kalaharituber pfeilii]
MSAQNASMSNFIITILLFSATVSASGVSVSSHEKPPVYKTLGIILALCSGVFIGISFVMKKKGLLAANLKDGKEAGEGYGYLKNWWWWGGMSLMILGEICNFSAYLFVEAILVTPLGALSVVVTAILSSIFLKERLSFIGKIGCVECIIGSTVIVVNAPKQAQVSTIQDMQDFVIAPGFLSFAGTIIAACIGIVVFAGPRWGNKSMLVYISVCSLIGGLSVACIQGIGAAIIAQANGIPQFNQWFTYFIIIFVIVTLLVEIVYLNKALNIFNAAIVTPTYYVFFTSSTIVTSAIMFRGFKGSPAAIATVCMGFLQICAGVVLLQLSKSAKNVPDAEVFRGDLDQVRTVAEQEEPEYEPKADAIRGTAAIIRRISAARQEKEAAEAHRIFDDLVRDAQIQRSGSRGDEHIEWDGVRRRVTLGVVGESRPRRRNTTSTAHPPLGMTRIPDIEEGTAEDSGISRMTSQRVSNRRRSLSVDAGMAPGGLYRGFQAADFNPEEFQSIWQRTKSLFVPKPRSQRSATIGSAHSSESRDRAPSATTGEHYPMSMTDIQRPESSAPARNSAPLGIPSSSHSSYLQPSPNYTIHHDWAYHPSSSGQFTADVSSMHAMTPPSIPAAQECSSSVKSGKSSLKSHTKQPGRQFSFQNIFHRAHRRNESTDSAHSIARRGLGLIKPSKGTNSDGFTMIGNEPPIEKTEEEILGLVKGDHPSREGTLPLYRDSPTDSESDDEKEKEVNVLYTVRRVPTDATTSDEADDENSIRRNGGSGDGASSDGSTVKIV